MDDKVDVAIIGAGVLGCAIASALARDGRTVVVLESGPRIGEGVTSRNSGVIHSGLYYPPGSLKALCCVEGNRRLYEWAARKGVAHAKLGKLVVARAHQLEALSKLEANAAASGSSGVERVGAAQFVEREPALQPAGYAEALWCAETGIVDPYELTRSFLVDAESRGAMLLVQAAVTGIQKHGDGWHLETGRGPLVAERVVNSAGLSADDIARLAGVTRHRVYPCRGDYFSLATPVRYSRLIYPLKDPASPGLGMHLTLDLGGRARIGPDAEYCERKDDFAGNDSKREKFRAAAEALLGITIRLEQVNYDSCGIRPKLRGPTDPAEVDFVVAEDLPGLVNLVGIESPGLTASMALASRVAALIS